MTQNGHKNREANSKLENNIYGIPETVIKSVLVGFVFGATLVGVTFSSLVKEPVVTDDQNPLTNDYEIWQQSYADDLIEPEPLLEAVNEDWHIIDPEELIQPIRSRPRGAGPIIRPDIVSISKIAPVPAKQTITPTQNNNPKIVIVIDDMGMNRGVTKRMVSLKGPITYSFLPYAENLEEQTEGAIQMGHELLVHLPMEPKSSRKDPGPNALLTSLDFKTQQNRITWNLNRFEGFKGVNNHMGSLFTENQSQMGQVISELKKRGLFFLDSRTSPKSVGTQIANINGVSWADRDIFLDNVREKKAIMIQLEKLEIIAKKKGHAIAIGHPYKITYETLKEWLPTLETKNLQLVPLSQVVHLENNKGLKQAGGAR